MGKKIYTPSRIGKQPVDIPKGVTVTVNGNDVTVKGPKGQLSQSFNDVTIALEGDTVVVTEVGQSKTLKAMHGLARALINNMVVGVSEGYTRGLEVQGVGYRMEQTGNTIKFSVGFSHPVMFTVPDGVTANVEQQTKLTLTAIDKELIGQVAAKIRSIRPPEPYKGKGIRYAGEHVRRKAGKATGK